MSLVPIEEVTLEWPGPSLHNSLDNVAKSNNWSEISTQVSAGVVKLPLFFQTLLKGGTLTFPKWMRKG